MKLRRKLSLPDLICVGVRIGSRACDRDLTVRVGQHLLQLWIDDRALAAGNRNDACARNVEGWDAVALRLQRRIGQPDISEAGNRKGLQSNHLTIPVRPLPCLLAQRRADCRWPPRIRLPGDRPDWRRLH